MADSNTVTTAVPVNLTGNTTTPASVQVAQVLSWLTFFIGLPAIGLAIYTLKNLSKGLYSVCSMSNNLIYTLILQNKL